MTESANPNPLSRIGEMLDHRFQDHEAALLLLTGTVNLLLQHACNTGVTHRAELREQVEAMCQSLQRLGSLQGSPHVGPRLQVMRDMLLDNLPGGEGTES